MKNIWDPLFLLVHVFHLNFTVDDYSAEKWQLPLLFVAGALPQWARTNVMLPVRTLSWQPISQYITIDNNPIAVKQILSL